MWTAGAKMVPGLCQFLTALRRAPQTLLLVWDNWPVHQHPTVLARAAREAIQHCGCRPSAVDIPEGTGSRANPCATSAGGGAPCKPT